MTRINCGISVKTLTDEHLLAEHREIKRLPGNFIKAKSSGSLKRIPKYFCLGTGHVIFFLDKFKYTFNRYKELYSECIARGFSVEDYSANWDLVDKEYFNDYIPQQIDIELLVKRISERILESKKDNFHYSKISITKKHSLEILKINYEKQIKFCKTR